MSLKKSEKENANLREARRMALHAASGLCYGEEVKRQLRNAKTVSEISKIMATARHNL